jgi:hypothetical protein
MEMIGISAASLSVQAQRGGKIRLNFDQRIVSKVSLIKLRSLPSGPCAKFD